MTSRYCNTLPGPKRTWRGRCNAAHRLAKRLQPADTDQSNAREAGMEIVKGRVTVDIATLHYDWNAPRNVSWNVPAFCHEPRRRPLSA